jgi:hypothetical protein
VQSGCPPGLRETWALRNFNSVHGLGESGKIGKQEKGCGSGPGHLQTTASRRVFRNEPRELSVGGRNFCRREIRGIAACAEQLLDDGGLLSPETRKVTCAAALMTGKVSVKR